MTLERTSKRRKLEGEKWDRGILFSPSLLFLFMGEGERLISPPHPKDSSLMPDSVGPEAREKWRQAEICLRLWGRNLGGTAKRNFPVISTKESVTSVQLKDQVAVLGLLPPLSTNSRKESCFGWVDFYCGLETRGTGKRTFLPADPERAPSGVGGGATVL